jgi:RAB protein geranylgeranyltransferase component A
MLNNIRVTIYDEKYCNSGTKISYISGIGQTKHPNNISERGTETPSIFVPKEQLC